MEVYHLQIEAQDIGKYCILPGDPGRCEKIASFLDNFRFISSNREYTIYTGKLNGTDVSVCSTGIGGPSTAIAIEELVALGAHTFIRVGTCGGINAKVKGDDCIIATSAVRQDGTSCEYAPIEYPATADFEIVQALVNASKKLNYSYHVGVVQSKDSFYGQHSPSRMPVADNLLYKWNAWKRLGVLCSEMEASTLFTVAASLNVRSGAILYALWNQEIEEVKTPCTDIDKAVRIAIEAIKELIEKDKE